MTQLAEARQRVSQAQDLGEVLDAAYDAFEEIRAATHHYHDNGGPIYPALILAAGAAAEGRDAIAFAPSLPPPSRPRRPVRPFPAEAPGWQDLAASVAGLSSELAGRLRDAAAGAAVAADAYACLDAAGYAAQIHDLASGNAP